jgi:hypothetical protein
VNVESFERVKIATPQDFVPADFKRLAEQLSNAAQSGEKLLSWEVLYFYSQLVGGPGIRLRKKYLDSLASG